MLQSRTKLPSRPSGPGTPSTEAGGAATHRAIRLRLPERASRTTRVRVRIIPGPDERAPEELSSFSSAREKRGSEHHPVVHARPDPVSRVSRETGGEEHRGDRKSTRLNSS